MLGVPKISMASKFTQALESYATALDVIEEATSHAMPEQILDLLLARDAIALLLKDKTVESAPDLLRLATLDVRLKMLATLVDTRVKLAEWRVSLQPSSDSWWWFLEPALPLAIRWQWFWNILSTICAAIALGLLLDVAPRFLAGGPDTWGAFAVIGQSLLTLLAAGGTLTTMGQDALGRWLTHQNISKTGQDRLRFGINFIMVSILLAFRLSLPVIAVGYNNSGLANYQMGHLASALMDYQRALKLNPDYAEAHYNLGVLYEDLSDFDQAKSEYQLAARSGLDAAYNNLARLNIHEEKYAEAMSLLLMGQKLVQDDEVRYDLLKNLGWTRLEQGRFAEAEQYLRDAIALRGDGAPAHCLLAKVLEGSGRTSESLPEWEQCLAFASVNNPDEDAWIGIAQERVP